MDKYIIIAVSLCKKKAVSKRFHMSVHVYNRLPAKLEF
ncbi:hypothetical protein U756_10600 [Streptococcus pneumoniae 27]|nr:hypothetical protein U756_10600 [Streptococcus pneumoniae 27]ETE24371.1 hypothetical protein U755_09650 [Streptococcus pneumoniae 1719]